MNAVMSSQRSGFSCLSYTKTHEYKWINVKLLKDLQGVETILFASCKCVDRPDTDIKTISCIIQAALHASPSGSLQCHSCLIPN